MSCGEKMAQGYLEI